LSIAKSKLENSLIEKVEPVLVELGYQLRDIECQGGLVRIILDSPAGVGIEDCSKAHQLLSPMFDVWDPIPGAYNLELSSPGEKPNLRTVEHFEEALGQNIRFTTTEPIEMPAPAKPRKNWEGVLKEVQKEKGEIFVEDSLGLHTISITKVKSAVWLREWSTSEGKKA